MLRAASIAGGIGLLILGPATVVAFAQAEPPTEGMLQATGPEGQALGPCPLEHTDVQVRITGFVARVEVTQKFHNPFDYKIEGVYVFPLSQNAAVDDMTMIVGDRVVRGVIKPREEARQIYEEAKAAGHVASLLDQERPNIFTQSVANIEPGERVEIRISYVENLDWQEGTYHFDFPTVVGPRYIPGGGTAPAPMTTGQPTPEVPDADKITPPVIPEGMRAGHDLSISVEIAAGFPIRELKSPQHEVEVEYADGIQSEANVTLKDRKVIPNKDFVLTYKTATDDIGDTLLPHFDNRGGFFTLVLQPPQRVAPEWIVPKEMIFVIDKSGSMNGFPIETAKKTMQMCIENLNPDDTFNLMTFAGGVGFCFDKPVPNTDENRAKALGYLRSLQGSGGTEMMKAINACLGGDQDPDRIRIVCFMTDGYVGNDLAIIGAVKTNAGTTRVFSFGIGRSVNRFLLDGMARAGRGEVEYVLSQAQADGAADRFYDRVSTPVLTDIEIDWGDLPVDEVYPQRIPDLFSAKPVVIKARYTAPASGTIRLTGRRGSELFECDIVVNLPGTFGRNEVIASLWARAKVEHLMDQDLSGIQSGQPDADIKDAIVKLGMEYRLLTQYTSFVAVEELTITRGGQPTKVLVPVEMPEGVSYDGVFGKKEAGGLGGGGPHLLFSVNGTAAKASMPLRRARAAPMSLGASMAEGEDRFYGLSAQAVLEAIDKDANLTPEQKRERKLQIKLAAELQGLAAKVGDDGNYSDGKVKVVNNRIEVAVHLADTSEATITKLESLGFKILVRTKSVKMVIGTIEVSKLEALALLEEVRRIQLPAFTTK
jgi:Ca-activated chloride channel family protein